MNGIKTCSYIIVQFVLLFTLLMKSLKLAISTLDKTVLWNFMAKSLRYCISLSFVMIIKEVKHKVKVKLGKDQ